MRVRLAFSLIVLGFGLVLAKSSAFYSLGLLAPVLTLPAKGDFEAMAANLTKKGSRALAPASLTGKSGVKHEFAFAVVPDSGKAKIVIDTELSVKEVDEMKVLKFYVKVFDVGPEKAVLCVTPKLGERAATLAKEYGIVVIEDETPRNLVAKAEEMVNNTMKPGGA